MNRSTVVRPGHAEDLPAILSIEAQCGSVTWSPDGFHTTLSDENHVSLVATAPDNTVRGFILAQVAADECTVHTIGVLPSCQRHGIGTMLLNGLIMHAERLGCAMMFLEVRSKNTGAQSFYRCLGFASSGKRKGYYGDDNDDAILMSRPLHLSV
jgi:ribosomal-protein-alanine N-acetyltransferase